MKPQQILQIATIALAVVVQSSWAQDGAAAKAKGTAYNFWQSKGWQQQAHGQARALYHYGQTPQPVAAQAKEHATALRQGITNAQKGLAELKKAHPDNAAALDSIAKIEAIHKKALGHCEMVDKAIMAGDHAELCACCGDVFHELDAVNSEMLKLQKALQIDNPELPKR